MNKEFVPYQPSLDMKEIGFDEPCVYYVDKNNESYIYNFETHPDEFIEWCGVNVIPTPTFSQAFRWFREKHRLQPSVNSFCFEEYSFIIMDNRNKILYPIQYKLLDDGKKNPWEFDTYEEAELHCLKKLIHIVKNK